MVSVTNAHDSDVATCPECGGQIARHAYETVCDECGLVIDEDPIDRSRNDTPRVDGQRTRLHNPVSSDIHDRGLGTQRTSQGAPWTNPYTARENARLIGFIEIRRLCAALELPPTVKKSACQLFRRVHDGPSLIGRSIETVAAASVFAAARAEARPVSLREVAEIADTDESTIVREARWVAEMAEVDMIPPEPPMYVGRIADELDLDPETERAVYELVSEWTEDGAASGLHPIALCATATVLIDDSFTQTQVAKAAGVSSETIRKQRKVLAERGVSI